MLQRLGLPDERVFTVALADLDRAVEPDHLTSVFVDTGERRGRGRARAARRPHRAAARSGRLPVGRGSRRITRCAATCSKRRTRSWRRSTSSRPTRRAATSRRRVRRARGRARRPPVPGDDPVGARGRGRRVHRRRRRAARARQARAPPPARVRRRARSTDADEVVTNWEQIKKDREGRTSRSSRASRPGCPSLLAVQKLLRKADAVALDPELAAPDLADDEAVGHALATIVAAGKCTTSTRNPRSPDGRAGSAIGSSAWRSSRAHGTSTSRQPTRRPPKRCGTKCDDSGTVRAFVRVTDTGGCSCGDGRAGWRPDAWRSRCSPRRAPGSHRRFRPLGLRPPSPRPRSTARTGATAPADEPAAGVCRPSSTATTTSARACATRARSCSTRRRTCAVRRARRSTSRWGVDQGRARRAASPCSTPASSGATRGRDGRPRRPRRTSTSARPRPPCAVAERRLQRRRSLRRRRLRRDRRSQRQRRRRSRGPDPRPDVQQRRDDDHNGYVDDISGLGLPLRRQRPARHRRATATAPVRPRTRPRPRTAPATSAPARSAAFLPVRVGDSFIADGGRFARRRALRARLRRRRRSRRRSARSTTRRRPSRRSTPRTRAVSSVVASMADEASKHPNLPASLEHTMAVNSVTEKEDLLGPEPNRLPRAQRLHELRRPHVRLDPVGRRARRRRRAVGRHGRPARVDRATPDRTNPRRTCGSGNNVLSANEVMQLVRATADDIDFSTPNAVDPANDFGTSTGGLLDTVRYPTTPGLGRHRSATAGSTRTRSLKAVRDGRIPPEADLTSPALVRRAAGARHRRRCSGRVAAPRADAPTTTASSGRPASSRRRIPATDAWHVVGAGAATCTSRDRRACSRSLDLASGRGRAARRRHRRAGRSRDGPARRGAVQRAGARRRHRPRRRRRRARRASRRSRCSCTTTRTSSRASRAVSTVRRARRARCSPTSTAGGGRRAGRSRPTTAASTCYGANGTDIPGWPVRTPDRVRGGRTARRPRRPTTSTQPGAAIGDGRARRRRPRR